MTVPSKPAAQLSPEEKRALLARLLQEKANQPKTFPLSFAQQRLWFLDQLAPGSSAYNIPIALRIRGRLDVSALERSINAIVRRHHSLRTSFPSVEGQPLQRVAPAQTVPLPFIDLGNLPTAQREDQARQIADTEALLPFDLSNGPLLRAKLARLSDNEHVLMITIHHIVFDEWSRGVFLRELVTFYTAFSTSEVQQERSLLPELQIQYADFAVWQRERLQGETLEAHLNYWREQLGPGGAPIPAVLDLPTNRPRPPIQTFNGAELPVTLSKQLSKALKELSQREGITLFMVLLAAYTILLRRYSGQTGIIVGSPITGRTRTELEGQIGFFMNTLVLHTDLSGNPTFRDVLHRVRDVCLGAYAHQELPFEKLVEELRLERNMSYSPLFQVMFTLRNLSADALTLPGLDLDWWGTHGVTAKVDLTLLMAESAEQIIGAFEYNTDLFDEATIARMAEHLRVVLEGMVSEPDHRILDVPLLTDVERQQIAARNQTDTAYPHTRCLHQLFEEQVQRSPDTTAVVFGHCSLTYDQLNQRANQLAHYLKSLGVGPEVRVGLCMARSLDMLVGLLGILKAGAAYIPIDPSYPQERIEFMLADAEMRVLLTSQEQPLAALPAGTAIVRLDADWPLIAGASTANPAVAMSPANLAYVIYTSGSTGKPKGVQITHQAVANFLWSMQQRPGMMPTDVLLSVTTLSFDIAVLEIFLPLITGARLALVTREVAADGAQLITALAETGATIMQATPVTWRNLLDAGWTGDRGLKILCGGEALSSDLAKSLCAGSAALWNMYGPTETTIWSAVGLVDPDLAVVPLGEAIANTQLYLLTPEMQIVPAGVAGELLIGGDGLARGYLNRPDLTAEKFVPDPFSTVPGARLYKTGDLARYHLDGTIEFLGRIDHQVKVRGFRIEIGEIETILRQHPAIRETVVVVREDERGIKQLVAYIILVEDQAPTITELRTFLREHLPEYMVPSSFVQLEQFPLTPNGKINRNKLPAPDSTRSELVGSLVPPRTTVERQLVQICEQLLGVSPIGITDDFFDLGGHSLLAVRLLAQIQKQFDRALPVATLFHSATVAHLATLIDTVPARADWSALVPLQPHGSKRPFFGVHPIGGNVLCYADLVHALGAEQPFYGLQAADLTHAGEENLRIEDMAADYIAAIRTVQPEGPYMLGGWSFGGLVAFEMAQQLRRQGQDVGLLVLLDTLSTPLLGESDTITDALVLSVIAQEQAIASGKTLPITVEDIQRLQPDEQLRAVLAAIKQAGIDLETDLDWVQQLLTGYRARSRAMRTYIPQVYPGQITLFVSTERDAETTKVQQLMGMDFTHPDYGWNAFSTHPVEVYAIPGYHNTFVQGPNAAVVAQHLRVCFERVQDAQQKV